MKIYNVLGLAALALQLLLSAFLAPPELGPWWGMVVGFTYLLISWFIAGVYLSDMIHLGIAHRALDYKEWFIKTVTLVNNTVGVYVDPVSWVNRHRLHHKFSDHAGDPNKLDADGFWKTLYLCVFPYPATADLATDDILKTWPMRLVSHPLFIIISPVLSCGFLWLFVRDWPFAIGIWVGVRIFALWVNMVQNYWTHDRRWGTRTYDDAGDNAMNIGDWLPVTATFSACWQNNHHHYPHLLRTTHAAGEFDFGYMSVRVMHALGLVVPSKTGTVKPNDLALAEVAL
jgi:stearoyl-CoA desaturase (delta-9 desaturase)